MDLDDLLEDLQSALPPELQVPTPEPPRPSSGQANGHDHLDHYYDRTTHENPERASVASTSAPFDDVQYSEVRKGPLYVPGQATGGDAREPEPELSPPPSKPPRDSLGASAGLSELDSLLEMLNNTQVKIDQASVGPQVSRPLPLKARSERVSVATCSIRDRVGKTSTLPPPSTGRIASGAFPYPHTLTRSSTLMSPPPSMSQSEPQPITERILEIGREMDDPKAVDLVFLLKDAKLLHQKLMALNLEDVDLKKVGLFSNEVLDKIEASKKRPKPNGVYKGATMSRVMSSTAASVSPKAATLGPNTRHHSMSSLLASPETSKKPRTKRGIFGAFVRSKSQKQASEDHQLQRSLSHVSSDGSLSKKKSRTLTRTRSRPSSPEQRRKKREASLPRSSSLDLLSNDFDEPSSSSSSSPPATPPTAADTRAKMRAKSYTALNKVEKRSSPSHSPSRSGMRLSRSVKAERSKEGASSVPSSPTNSRKNITLLKYTLKDDNSSSDVQSTLHSSLNASTKAFGPSASSLSNIGGGRRSWDDRISAPPTTPPNTPRHTTPLASTPDPKTPPTTPPSSLGPTSPPTTLPTTPRPSVSPTTPRLKAPPTTPPTTSRPKASPPTTPIPKAPPATPPGTPRLKASPPSTPNLKTPPSTPKLKTPPTTPPIAPKPKRTPTVSPKPNPPATLPKPPKPQLKMTHSVSTPDTKKLHPMHVPASETAFQRSISMVDGVLSELSCKPPAVLLQDHTPQSSTLYRGSESRENESSPVNKSAPSPSMDPRATRPSVATLVDELTQVEEQVGGGTDDSFDSPTHASRDGKGAGLRRPNVTASSATLELDQLMQNLEDFEPPPAAPSDDPGQQKPKSAMDNLSNMLGSLEQDMEMHGVSTVAKGMCAACKKPILAKVLDALGRQWHPEHFTCASCDMELGNTTYYESNGRPYCEKDYHELYAPRCAYCNGPILERVMRALDKTWHPEHFFCALCGKKFGSEGFHEKDGKAFCRECYYENYAPRCKRCDKAIMEGFITALNAQWHPECFSCKVCNVTFPRGNYFEHEGEPHCELHYHASRGTLCASCQKPVTGKCVTAMGRKWHPEHFTCAFCLKLLNKGTFKEHRHNPYCQPCYIKLFG